MIGAGIIIIYYLQQLNVRLACCFFVTSLVVDTRPMK